MVESQLMHLMLVSGRDQTTEWLLSVVRAEKGIMLTGWSMTLDHALELAGQHTVDLVLMDTTVPDGKQLERLQLLTSLPNGPAVILMVDPTEVPFVQKALLAGARGFLLKPFTEGQLMESLHQTFAAVLQQRKAVGATIGSATLHARSAQLLVVFSPKGGLGRTTIATNLAVALHQETRRNVTLVDGDLQFGDVDIAVNAIAHTSIADLLSYVNDLEPSLIESAMLTHPTGIRLLLAPAYFDPALEASEGRLTHVLKAVAAMQDGYVVVDAPAGLNEATLSLLDIAQHVVLVTNGTLASLRATKRFLELTSKLDYPPDKILMVLNNYRKEADIPVEGIERHLNWPVTSVVPSDPAAMSMSLSQGQPIIYRDKHHAASKAILKLARHLVSDLDDETRQTAKTGVIAPSADKHTGIIRFSLKPGQALGT